MNNKPELSSWMDYFQFLEKEPIQFKHEAIQAEYDNVERRTSINMYILSIVGGILACLAFTAFLLLAGVFKSGESMLIAGLVFIGSSLLLIKKIDNTVMATICVATYIIGFAMFGSGLIDLVDDLNLLCFWFVLLSLVSFFVHQNFLIHLVSVLILNGSILSMIINSRMPDLMHFYTSCTALFLCFLFLKEAYLITRFRKYSFLYAPIRIGMVLSFLSGLYILVTRGILKINENFIWLTSLVLLACILYMIYTLFQTFQIQSAKQKVLVLLLSLLILLPSIFSPAISGSILLIMLSFRVNYYTGLTIGLAGMVAFLSQYYYDLSFTLLTKSILLMASGMMFLALYFWTSKKQFK